MEADRIHGIASADTLRLLVMGYALTPSYRYTSPIFKWLNVLVNHEMVISTGQYKLSQLNVPVNHEMVISTGQSMMVQTC